MSKPVRALIPLLIVFTFFSIVILLFSEKLRNAGFDTTVLLVANILFFVLSIASFFIQHRGMNQSNPHVFVRSVMAGMMMKIIVCIIVTFAYVYLSGSNYNKRSVFTGLMLYLVYLPIEVVIVMQLNKKKNA